MCKIRVFNYLFPHLHPYDDGEIILLHQLLKKIRIITKLRSISKLPQSFTMIKKICISSFFLLCFLSCSKSELIPTDLEVNNFIWKGLNAYYLWQPEISDLADTRFSSQIQLNDYLRGFAEPRELFYSLLNDYPNTDRFSWIVDDYIALENALNGINQTNGMEFGLVRYNDNPLNLFGYVRYVIPGSDAELQGIQRGMLFNLVNGVALNELNYESLLFSSASSYTITLADYNNGNPVSNGVTYTLTKTQLQENPIAIATTFDEGGVKVGYLLYHQFLASYNGQLNAVFAAFKAQGIQELIIDLRYNPGGSVQTATYLGSMVTGQFNGQLFSKEVWNTKVQANVNPDNFINNFTDRIDTQTLLEPINSLQLNQVYCIVSGSTASASELLINSLRSYIDVKLVGTTTVGKHVGSVTLYDSPTYAKAGVNPNHTWAMQPIVLEIQNKDGENKPEGFTPEVFLAEDYENLGVLGDRSEPLLSRTLTYITTGSKFTDVNKSSWKPEVSHSKLHTLTKDNMFVKLRE